MAQKRASNIYRTQGAAAYDVRKQTKQRVELPGEKKAPVQVKRVRATMNISPFAVFGLVAAVFMAILVVFGYVRLYEASEAIATKKNEISTLQNEQAKLQSVYEDKFDLTAVEEQAAELGMIYPKSSQVVYVNLSGMDRAEITPAKNTNPISVVYYAIYDSIKGFVEYLS